MVGKPVGGLISNISARWANFIFGGLTFVSVLLWIFSTYQAKEQLSNQGIGDLGLFSVMPFHFFIAFGLLVISFFFSNRYATDHRSLLLLFETLCLVFFLNLTQVIVEGTARTATSYANFVSVDYITQTGHASSSFNWVLNWPGFCVLMSIFTQITIIPEQTVLLFYPVAFNVLLLLVLYVFFRAISKDSKLVWSATWFVYLGFWTGQDYFSMQSLGFMMSILVSFLLLKIMNNEMRNRQWGVLAFLSFFYIVSSHLLTSLVVLSSLAVLLLSRAFRRPLLFLSCVSMVAAWTVFNAAAYLSSNIKPIIRQFLDFGLIFQTNLEARLSSGSPIHVVVAQTRVVYSGILIFFAVFGFLLMWKEKKMGLLEKRLLAFLISLLPLLFAFSYGGELFQRVFMFSLLPVAYFAYNALRIKPVLWASLFFFVLFAPSLNMIAHYGNEIMDHVPSSEITAIDFLYTKTLRGSIVGGASLTGDLRDLHYHENYVSTSFSYISLRYDSSKPWNWSLLWGSKWNALEQMPAERYIAISRSTFHYCCFFLGKPQFLQNFQGNVTQSVSWDLFYSNPSVELYYSAPPAQT